MLFFICLGRETYSVNLIDSYRFEVLECSSHTLKKTHCFKGLGSWIGAKEGSPERSLEGLICAVQILTPEDYRGKTFDTGIDAV